MRFTSY